VSLLNLGALNLLLSLSAFSLHSSSTTIRATSIPNHSASSLMLTVNRLKLKAGDLYD
jgi:hypothetical protein